MLTYGGRRRRQMSARAEINITNLVDVAFVLLIIFMITAPIMQGGIDVQLASAEAQPIQQAEPVIVSVTAEGEIFVGEAQVASLDELETVLRTFVPAGSETPVAMKPDAAVDWDVVAGVLGRLRALEIENMFFVVEPESGR